CWSFAYLRFPAGAGTRRDSASTTAFKTSTIGRHLPRTCAAWDEPRTENPCENRVRRRTPAPFALDCRGASGSHGEIRGHPARGRKRRRRRLLLTTKTELNAIAAPASMGFSRPAA